jgi:hypothetical protein
MYSIEIEHKNKDPQLEPTAYNPLAGVIVLLKRNPYVVSVTVLKAHKAQYKLTRLGDTVRVLDLTTGKETLF